jgi:hypothetical protein
LGPLAPVQRRHAAGGLHGGYARGRAAGVRAVGPARLSRGWARDSGGSQASGDAATRPERAHHRGGRLRNAARADASPARRS